MMQKKNHWEDVYQKKKVDEVSWYQMYPELSLLMIESAKLSLDTPIIDVGGGASRLVDRWVEKGFRDITVLDISGKALAQAQARLGKNAHGITWIEGDILEFVPGKSYEFWHDRAVFHFLTEPEDRYIYLNTMHRALSRSGYSMIATFAMDGPERCSGLPVQRYSYQSLSETLGKEYNLVAKHQESHITPAGNSQNFIFGLFKKIGN